MRSPEAAQNENMEKEAIIKSVISTVLCNQEHTSGHKYVLKYENGVMIKNLS